MSSTIRIKDTGLNKVGGTEVFTKINSGNWTELKGFSLRGEFGTQGTDYQSQRESGGLLTWKSNEVTALMSPRFTLQGLVDATDATLIANIIKFGRSKGVKRITGGLGLIAALPEVATDTYSYVSIKINNITFTEVQANSTNYINFTIQCEQVN